MNVELAGNAARVVREFAIDGECADVEPFERGHIHDTFISTWQQGDRVRRYLHQRMNDAVFGDIPALMHNVERVTQHLRSHPGEPACTLELVRTRGGDSYLRDRSGPWRTYHFVEQTESHDHCESEDQAFEAARAFAHFQAELRDLDAGELKETLPSFFSSPHRLRQLDAVLARDPVGRAAGVRPELAFVDRRRSMVPVVDDLLRRGVIPTRVVHGDTKLNNVLFDIATRRAVCIVDLDTCMPGYSLYDFGDLVRFTAATSSEDETDLALAGTDLGLYRALVAGYREGAGDSLSAKEIELMPFAAKLVTLTIGLRFLTDHLAGDVYFKIARPGHNLDRARVQFAMVAQMERTLSR